MTPARMKRWYEGLPGLMKLGVTMGALLGGILAGGFAGLQAAGARVGEPSRETISDVVDEAQDSAIAAVKRRLGPLELDMGDIKDDISILIRLECERTPASTRRLVGLTREKCEE